MKDTLQGIIYIGAFLVLFIPLLVTDSMFFPYITGKNFAFRIIVEIIFAAWVLLAFLDARYRPRFSWIMIAGAAFLGVMFVADLFGEYAPKSFGSNFERMEGYVTLLHFYLYFLVLGHMFRSEKVWIWFWNTALVAASIVGIYALQQAISVDLMGQNVSWRLDARLGNSTYLGVYMLFQVFISAWLFIRAKSGGLRWLYGGLLILFLLILFHTGTRGTTLGIFGGSILSFAYLAIMADRGAAIKKWAVGGLLVIVLTAVGLWLARDSEFVRSVPMLDRVAGITLAEGNIRFTVWQMALEGFKEHPILGWGQENFNYVFNQYYKPSLYGAESWYDRTHNILLDWLIAGGILGLLAYLSLLLSALWYAVLDPVWKRFRTSRTDEEFFSVYEQSLLFGLLAAYTFHNLFVFDNLISYIFYAVVLALVHSRVSSDITWLTDIRVDAKLVSGVGAPVVAIMVISLIYFAHMPGIHAAQDIIDGLKTTDVDERFLALERAVKRDSFARQEVVEQMVQQSISMALSPNIPVTIKEKYLRLTESEMKKLIADKPGDARLHAFMSNLYRSAGQFDLAKEQLDIAHELSPGKQALILEQGTIHAIKGEYEMMRDLYKQAFDLDHSNNEARFLYAGSLMYTKEQGKIGEIITDEYWSGFAMTDKVLLAAKDSGSFDLLVDILKERIRVEPDNAQHRAALSSVYYDQGRVDEAVKVLQEAIEDIPIFTELGQCYIASMRSGTDPRTACQP